MFKRYLWCFVLALGLSGSAYATKGGNVGGHIKKNVVSRLANSKLGRGIMTGLFGFTVFCSGITGCGNGNNPVSTTETEAVQVTEVTETVEVTNRYNGDSIIFVHLGTFHEASVIKGVSEDEVLVELADDSKEVISVNQIAGTLIADHPDVGTEVVMLSEREGEKRLKGEIIEGYTDGMRKIEFFGVTLVDGTFKVLNSPRILFLHENTDFEKGGYLTLAEFGRLIDNRQ